MKPDVAIARARELGFGDRQIASLEWSLHEGACVELITANVIATRLRGALGRIMRGDSVREIAAGNEDSAHLEKFIPWTQEGVAQAAASTTTATASTMPLNPGKSPTSLVAKGEPKREPAAPRAQKPVPQVPAAPFGAIEIWTDGSGNRADRPGGAGGVIIEEGVVVSEISLPLHTASVNEAETAAIGAALCSLADRLGHRDAVVILYSDSEFAIGAVRHGSTWNVRANARLGRLVARVREEVKRWCALSFLHVPGHCGLQFNERADELAGLARKRVIARAAAAATATGT